MVVGLRVEVSLRVFSRGQGRAVAVWSLLIIGETVIRLWKRLRLDGLCATHTGSLSSSGADNPGGAGQVSRALEDIINIDQTCASPFEFVNRFRNLRQTRGTDSLFRRLDCVKSINFFVS